MDNKTIPLRDNSNIPGLIRLPSRYNVIICPQQDSSYEKGQVEDLSNTITDRLRDMTQAIMWIKQEMIFLRQHDILLKRQFLDINDTITSMKASRNKLQGHTRIYRKCSHSKASSNTSLHSNASSIDITLDNYFVRPACSATALNDDGSDNDDHNIRPRTSSMKTTRDLAALARRRGSKELI